MKKIVSLAVLSLAMMPAAAQDTYENARLLGSDLNGTARYVGMGGALDALGADISSISTNPAAIGVFRHSTASASIGIVSQEEVKRFDQVGKTNFSIDQAGFVYSTQTGYNSFLNFAFNYHKSRNFDQILSAANNLQGSLGKLAYQKSCLASERQGGYYLEEGSNGTVDGWRDKVSNDRAYTYTQWDHVYTNGLNWDQDNFPASETFKNVYFEGTDYSFDRAHSGWIGNFDFNLSGNINNQVFLGLTLGLKQVNYKGYSEYQEFLVDGQDRPIGNTVLADERKITGTGVDLSVGAIFRPFEESAFRFGVSIHLQIFDATGEQREETGRGCATGFKVGTHWQGTRLRPVGSCRLHMLPFVVLLQDIHGGGSWQVCHCSRHRVLRLTAYSG